MSLDSQAASHIDDDEMLRSAIQASAFKMFIAEDAVIRSWPRYEAMREDLRKELAATIDLDKATVDQLSQEAVRLERVFWEEEGMLSPEGYREAFKARVLMEIAHQREPDNLAVSDDLARAISTAYPMNYYDAQTKDFVSNLEVWTVLRALRAANYAQTRQEVEQGRPFVWEDFARVSDFVYLFGVKDPARAADALDWALSRAGSGNIPHVMEPFFQRLASAVRAGGGVSFGVYEPHDADYPHDFLYGRRPPSFRDPAIGGRSYTPYLTMNAARQ